MAFSYRMTEGRRCRGDIVERTVHILGLLYAVDLVLVWNNENNLRDFVIIFGKVTNDAGLEITLKKAEILVTKTRKSQSNQESFSLHRVDSEKVIESVSEFVYLCILLTESGCNTK